MTSHTQHLEGLHVITDRHASLSVIEQAKQAAQNGASVIQLRDKIASDAQMILWGKEILNAIAPYPCRLIINDRIDVAIQVQAHGLHVGQKDGNIEHIRQKIGCKMILGLSITAPRQLKSIPKCQIDYIGVGPLRATTSKKDHDLPLGFEGIKEIISLTKFPVITIGGIVLEDLSPLKKAGSKGIAVISAISQNKNPSEAIALFSRTWKNLA
ncbi:thiamine phosphate synthase [Acetobacteraceae bacterium]|nr:thiamine phosphate synthase [Acetobacteraceae bacterium]